MEWDFVYSNIKEIINTPLFGLILFIIIQFINVVFSTIKSVATIKSSPITAARLNGLSYTISNILTKFLVSQSFLTVIISTYITNRVGVQFGRYIMDKKEPEKLWVYKCNMKITENKILDLKQLFKDNSIDCIYTELCHNEKYLLEIFVYTRQDSVTVKEILSNYNCYCHIEEPIEWCKFEGKEIWKRKQLIKRR